MATVGNGSHLLEFYHPEVGYLRVRTGADRIAWGYSLNTAVFPTYAGEVVQILSCFIDDLEIAGTLQTYSDIEQVYTYFLRYTQAATQGDPRRSQVPGETSFNQQPMEFSYPHRGWHFKIMPKEIPGFRRARDQTVCDWRITAHVIDDEGDAAEIKDLILQEAEIKAAIGSRDQNFDDNFGLTGQIRFLDENPFSDPFTDAGTNFAAARAKGFKDIGDAYSKLLPAYLDGSFEDIFGNLGSQPAFSTKQGAGADAAANKGDAKSAFDKEYDKLVQASKNP